MTRNHGLTLKQEQRVWRILDALEIYGADREKAEKELKQFQKEVEERTEEQLNK